MKVVKFVDDADVLFYFFIYWNFFSKIKGFLTVLLE